MAHQVRAHTHGMLFLEVQQSGPQHHPTQQWCGIIPATNAYQPEPLRSDASRGNYASSKEVQLRMQYHTYHKNSDENCLHVVHYLQHI